MVDIKEINKILNFMVLNFLNHRKNNYISVEQYIDFFKLIPESLWATRPIFYYRKEKYDALGFLGESPHRYTLQSKTLSLYFHEILGYTVTSICDEHIKDESPKTRFINILEKLSGLSSQTKLRRVFNKANEMYNDRYY